MKESQKARGKPPGLSGDGNRLPPSETWASDPTCQKVCSILSRYGRFIHFHFAGALKGTKRRPIKKFRKSNTNRNKRSQKYPQARKIDEESFQEINNKEALWNLAELIDIYREKDKCYVFFFKAVPFDFEQDIDSDILDYLNTHFDGYFSTIFKLRKLLEPRFIRELIIYLNEIHINKKLVKDLIGNNKNFNLQTADTFVQYAFAKYLNGLPTFPKTKTQYTKANVMELYDQFYQKEQQFIIDETYCLLYAFEEQPLEQSDAVQTLSAQQIFVDNEQQEQDYSEKYII